MYLNQYSFDLRYVPGKLNILADALSRLDRADPDLEEFKHICAQDKFVDLTMEQVTTESRSPPPNVTIVDSILDNLWVELATGD